jgi:large subunit ribosomal protein L10
MSKYLKNLMTSDLSKQLDGVQDALLVNVIGLPANQTCQLRKELREKEIHLVVVKSSLARRACEGTPLAAAFDGMEGAMAVLWGSTDLVSLAKIATRLHKSNDFAAFQTRGGVMDGEPLTAERVEAISRWPSREEQLSILVGQILAPARNLAGVLVGPGAQLASQIEKISEGDAQQTS